MSDGHFRSLQPRNGRCLLQKICLQKSPHFEKSRAKIPLVMGVPLKGMVKKVFENWNFSYFLGIKSEINQYTVHYIPGNWICSESYGTWRFCLLAIYKIRLSCYFGDFNFEILLIQA